MSETNPARFLIKMPPALHQALAGQPLRLKGAALRLRPLCANEELGARPGMAPPPRWYLATAGPGGATPGELWQQAHESLGGDHTPLARQQVYIEPDLGHSWAYDNPVRCRGLGAAPGETCVYNPPATDLPAGPGFAWHLGDDFSQLKAARDQVRGLGPAPVRVAILDVGFDLNHRSRPEQVREDLQRNFVDDGQGPADIHDPYERGLFKNPGHGTATMGILAGAILQDMAVPEADTRDYLGGAPQAEVIPVRIATSVILMYTSALAEALDYLIAPGGNPDQRAEVVSMSMGGLASRAWAEVVNRAYEAGICLVTAAGNNFFGTPQSLVYPARFRRVIAACGVMADGRAYIRDEVPRKRMAGNFGPHSLMDTALAAYTPNMPWAEINCPDLVDMDGAGTSAATPQIAAAAALWLQKYKGQLHYQQPWQIVEAVRRALFSAADKTAAHSHTYFGQGRLRALASLGVQPAPDLTLTPPDDVCLPFFRVLTGLGMAPAPPSPQALMLEVEARQLLQRHPDIEATLQDPDLPPDQIKDSAVREFLEAALASGLASPTLQAHLEKVYVKKFSRAAPGAALSAAAGPRPALREVETPQPRYRRLQSYAFDPELSNRLETSHINEVVFEVPWEEDLGPGPRGEYLEVIDHDPASGCFYAPVDLGETHLLATDGLAPSDGNPKFRQQMVYAVAMRTIFNFERALGRKALWAPRMQGRDDREFVPRLRVYPHALREANAYYDPEKKALLFGYFPAGAADPGKVYPGGMVFTCLSHDIIAHETTHALLDGMYRRLSETANEDQLAFHEAFADIVALFQHFSMPEVLAHQIGKTRGDLRARNFLGELAQQFGQASGLHGALRSAIGEFDPETKEWRPLEPDPGAFQSTSEPHDRGSLLVAAVFDAFLSIFETRTADLKRLASQGTGVLPLGAIHPDLVGRLSRAAAKSAQHVLTMCVRALDYCPPVDLTFGDYLRALITADLDLVPDDTYNYRVAFVEAFRRRGIYPRDLPTLSVDSLIWHQAREDGPQKLLRPLFERLGEFANRFQALESRKKIFDFSRKWRTTTHDILKNIFQKSSTAERRELMGALGLDLRTGTEHFEVHQLRVSNKQGPDGTVRPQILLYLIQETNLPTAGSDPMVFSGGCTIIADQYSSKARYYVRKNILSPSRRERQQAHQVRQAQSLASLYFGAGPLKGMGQRFAMLHADREDY